MFKDAVINDEEHDKTMDNYKDRMININTNNIPNNVVMIDKLFDVGFI